MLPIRWMLWAGRGMSSTMPLLFLLLNTPYNHVKPTYSSTGIAHFDFDHFLCQWLKLTLWSMHGSFNSFCSAGLLGSYILYSLLSNTWFCQQKWKHISTVSTYNRNWRHWAQFLSLLSETWCCRELTSQNSSGRRRHWQYWNLGSRLMCLTQLIQ